MNDEQLHEYLQHQGYTHVRQIGGVWCGLSDYLTTRAIAIGLNVLGYDRRYCYQNRTEANAGFEEYTDPTQHPMGEWIKLKAGGVNRRIYSIPDLRQVHRTRPRRMRGSPRRAVPPRVR